jgi:hypothetical protein
MLKRFARTLRSLSGAGALDNARRACDDLRARAVWTDEVARRLADTQPAIAPTAPESRRSA